MPVSFASGNGVALRLGLASGFPRPGTQTPTLHIDTNRRQHAWDNVSQVPRVSRTGPKRSRPPGRFPAAFGLRMRRGLFGAATQLPMQLDHEGIGDRLHLDARSSRYFSTVNREPFEILSTVNREPVFRAISQAEQNSANHLVGQWLARFFGFTCFPGFSPVLDLL
jgi:hypothetical protein